MEHLRQQTVRWTARWTTLAAACVATAGWAAAQDQGQTETPPDARKSLVERRTEQVIEPVRRVRVDLPADATDLRKEAIEVRTESLLAAPATGAAAESPKAGRLSPDDPKVAPGLVRWHADLAAAQAAARVSGKPVLVFQMLGNLDDEFC